MIVDAHTHFFRPETDFGSQVREDLARCGIDVRQWQSTAEEHLNATAAADAVVVFGLQAQATGWHAPNDAVAAHVSKAPDRLIFFASPDPGQEGYMAELERCHQVLGCQGVKLGPIYQGVHPLDKRYYEIYRYCAKHGLPIMIHMATTFSSGTPLEYARPAHMDQVAVDFPDLKIVLPHLGHPWEGETIAAIRRQPNLYADISALYGRPWQFYNSMRLLVEYGADHNVLFGSDYPFTTTADSIAGLCSINKIADESRLPPIPEEVIEGILHRDTLKLLGLKLPSRTEGRG